MDHSLRQVRAGCVCAVLLFSVAAAGQAKDLLKPDRVLARALSALLRGAPARSGGISIAVAPVGDGELAYGYNASTPLTIASVSKLFSTAAALHFLGRSYTFNTTVWRHGEVRQGTLLGSLLVVGGGDPNISGRFYDNDTQAIFDKWSGGLAAAGIHRIDGDIVLNASFFDDQYRSPGWPEGQEARWYEAPVAALSFNDNTVVVNVQPGRRPGSPARITLDPPTAFVRAVGTVRTVRGSRGARVAVNRSAGSRTVWVSGRVPFRIGGWSAVVAIDDPPLYFGTVLRERLEAGGISVGGRLIEQALQPDPTWTLVATTKSDLLPSIAIANKRSQSFYAEQILKTLAAEKGSGGTWAEGVRLEKEFLGQLGLDPQLYELHDGSGLDPRNRVSADALVAFLRAMARQPEFGDWKRTLAVAGSPDGSLRHRLRQADTVDRVWAKTGSLNHVNSLAGYVQAESGQIYAFAIILNGRRVHDGSAHAFEDRIVRVIVRKG